ncbi:MAG: hypothetical protein NUW01_12250 [Gemmatimonadaceae bacterium]|nr:hypothetical protein [Gemmatimonadaceae bacterium]
MTFENLYGEKLTIELASSDTTQLFTTARRKQAINDAALAFARITGCTKKYGSVSIVDGTQEYDLEANFTDYMRLAGAPSVKIVTSSDTRYIQGPKDLPQREAEWLDANDPNWRAVSAGTPQAWYVKSDGGAENLGFYPAPDVGSGETWSVIVPYVATPLTMSATSDVPFSLGTSPNAMIRLAPFHQALAHGAAASLELLRKNYSGAQRQTAIFNGYVAQFLGQTRVDGPSVVTFARDYYGEGRRVTVSDPWR